MQEAGAWVRVGNRKYPNGCLLRSNACSNLCGKYHWLYRQRSTAHQHRDICTGNLYHSRVSTGCKLLYLLLKAYCLFAFCLLCSLKSTSVLFHISFEVSMVRTCEVCQLTIYLKWQAFCSSSSVKSPYILCSCIFLLKTFSESYM